MLSNFCIRCCVDEFDIFYLLLFILVLFLNWLEIEDLNLQVIPSDQHLKILSSHIGNCPFQLGIELGLSYKDVKQSLFSFPRNLPGLVESILAKWKKNLKVTTIHSLIMALGRVDAGGFQCLLETSKCPCTYLQK